MSNRDIKTIFIKSGTTFNVPSDFKRFISVEAIGAGGGTTGGGGGGGGSYAKSISITNLTPGQSIYVNVGAGVQGSPGGNSWFNIQTNSPPTTSANGVFAEGGLNNSGGAAPQTSLSNLVGDIIRLGGGGGYYVTTGRGGGGGAAGPDFDGGFGANGAISGGGGGGGGANLSGVTGNGKIAFDYNGGDGGQTTFNDLTTGGAGPAAVGTIPVSSAYGGGGGGGGSIWTIAAPGSNGIYWTQTSDGELAGPGGGGGGGGGSSTTSSLTLLGLGSNGGNYGGGRGGGGSAGGPYSGGQGIIIFTYEANPAASHSILSNGIIGTENYLDETTGTSSAQFANSSINGILDEFYGAMPATYGGSFGLNSTGFYNYLTFPNTNIGSLKNTKFTIEGYVYVTDTLYNNGTDYRATIFSTNNIGSFTIQLYNTLPPTASIPIEGLYVNGGSNVFGGYFPYKFKNNTWYHIAVQVEYDGTLYYYWQVFVDGINIKDTYGYFITQDTLGTWNEGTSYAIGRRASGSLNYFGGVISNFRIVKNELVYANTIVFPNTVDQLIQNKGFTPPNWPLTNTANTKFLSLQDSTFIDNSSSPVTITNNNGVVANQINKTSRIGPNATIYPADSFWEKFYSGGTIQYSLGSGGTGGIDTANGSAGGQSTLYFRNITLTANGGNGGIYNTTSNTAGGTASGGLLNVTGGTGYLASGDVGGGGGGGINLSNAVVNGINSFYGSNGASAIDLSGLSSALNQTIYILGSSTEGANNTSSGQNFKNGASALANSIGNGGAGAGYYGGFGGNGGFGGGGGGAAGFGATNRKGGDGGDGILVIQIDNKINAVFTTGSSYDIPLYASNVKVWLIGAGGGGAGSTNVDAGAGAGGGAGGIAYYSWSL